MTGPAPGEADRRWPLVGADVSLPLYGVRVLDFSALLPGPFASLILAEAGAEVARIEPARTGDPLRSYEPRLGEVSALYAMLNRGKRAYGADLSDPADRAVVLELAEVADVVLVQARPGVPERQGIGAGELRAANPRLVYCSITGYGSSGPRADRPGYDLAFMADSGLLGAARSAAGAPVLPATSVADIAGGTYPAVVNILLALRQRDRTGEGTFIEISMTHHLQPLIYRHFARRQATGEWGDPGADLLGGGSARYQLYETADGRFVAVYALTARTWEQFAAVLKLDPQFVDGGDSRAAIEAVSGIIARQAAGHWRAVFAETGARATVVADFAEAEQAGTIETASADLVRSGHSVAATLPSLIVPGLRRPPGILEAPTLGNLQDRALID